MHWRTPRGIGSDRRYRRIAFTGITLWLAGLVVGQKWVTRPVEQLTSEVNDLEQDSISAIKVWPPGRSIWLLKTKLNCCVTRLSSYRARLLHNGINWLTVTVSAGSLSPISHDLRTPLTSLLGYLETLSLKSATLSAEEQNQYLAIALRQGQKCAISLNSCLNWRALSMGH
jgi:signal transduction histidine kinase